MKIVKKNPDAAIQTLLKSIAGDRTDWHGFLFTPAPLPDYEEMIAPPQHINGRLHKLNTNAATLANTLIKKSPSLKDGAVFIMSGGLVIVIVHADLFELYTDIAKKSEMEISRIQDLDGEKMEAHLSPHRKRMAVYDAIADTHKVRGIGFRRDRHKDGLVLVVDDDKFTAAYVANLLKNDYDVVAVRNGEEAICAYIKYAPNLVILDIHMPGMGGHRTLNALRTIDDAAPVVVVTADDEDSHIFAAARAGAVGYLKKPLSKDKLLETIKGAPSMKKFNPVVKSTGKR